MNCNPVNVILLFLQHVILFLYRDTSYIKFDFLVFCAVFFVSRSSLNLFVSPQYFSCPCFQLHLGIWMQRAHFSRHLQSLLHVGFSSKEADLGGNRSRDCFCWTRVRSLFPLVTNWLTHSLTHSLLFSKLDWCDLILKLKFGHKIEFLSRLWEQSLIKILTLKHGREFEAEFWSVFCCWSLVEVMKIILGRDSEATFGQDF